MDQQVLQKLEEQEKKIDAIYKSVERTRKYFLWTMIATIAFFVLPLVGLAFVIPMLMSQMSTLYNTTGLY